MFGVVFVGQSFPIDSSAFQQSGPHNWILDVTQCVNPNFSQLKEICLFLSQPNTLDPAAALGVYVSVGNQGDWQYRGRVSNARPSDVFPIRWPTGQEQVQTSAQIGISVEPLAELEQKEGARLGAKEEFAKKVAMNLYHFLESFNAGTPAGRDQLVVPANFLDRWFAKFQARFRRDPDFLTRDG